MSELWVASYVLLWVIVGILAFVCVGLLRQLGLVQLRLGGDPGVLITPEGIERGQRAPDFEALDVLRRLPVRLSDLAGSRLLLAFVSPSCLACHQLMPHLNDLSKEHSADLHVAIICYGTINASEEFARQNKITATVLADPTNGIAAAYGVQVTPFAFLIDEHGDVLIRGVVNTWPQLDALLAEEGTFQGDRPWRRTEPSRTALA